MRLVRRSTIGVLTHVICRFVDRRWMITDDIERKTHVELLGYALARSDCRCVAYALMSSHLHFAMIPGHDELQTWPKRVNSPFARWLNAQHDRLGPVFADRPAEWSVRANKSALISYIHNNPVRARVG
jgi:putative transposase